MNSIKLIQSLMLRADKLLSDLQLEYDKCLSQKEVPTDALNLTHEVIEKCANALDQLMHHCWEVRIAPKLTNIPKRGGYFPAARDEQSFKSTLGQWNAADLDTIDPAFAKVLRQYQPLKNEVNNWLVELRTLSSKKHTGLVPQKKFEERRVSVTSSGCGSVSWGSGVRFGSGVSVLGAPIDPRTQLPIPTAGVQTTVEIWVNFVIEGTNLNAVAFCNQAVKGTKEILTNFALSLNIP